MFGCFTKKMYLLVSFTPTMMVTVIIINISLFHNHAGETLVNYKKVGLGNLIIPLSSVISANLKTSHVIDSLIITNLR